MWYAECVNKGFASLFVSAALIAVLFLGGCVPCANAFSAPAKPSSHAKPCCVPNAKCNMPSSSRDTKPDHCPLKMVDWADVSRSHTDVSPTIASTALELANNASGLVLNPDRTLSFVSTVETSPPGLHRYFILRI